MSIRRTQGLREQARSHKGLGVIPQVTEHPPLRDNAGQFQE